MANAALANAAPDLLLQLLDLAAEAGDVDERQLADTLGLTPGALRRALAEPAALSAEHAMLVGGALGVDAGVIRTLRRRAGASGAADAPAASRDTPDPPPVPALGTVALLAAIVEGIVDDDAGRALRVAVLDVAAGAARAAGRALPPAAHELRARVLRAPVGLPASTPPNADPNADPDPSPIAAVAAVVEELQRAEPGYDGIFAPLADDAIDGMLRRFGVVTHLVATIPAGTRYVLTPPLFGRMRVLRSAHASADQQRVIARTVLAHVVAGHVREDVPLGSPAPQAAAAVADGVALADLVPFWQLADLRRKGRLGWQGLREHVGALAMGITHDWDAKRAARRGEERVALFRARAV